MDTIIYNLSANGWVSLNLANMIEKKTGLHRNTIMYDLNLSHIQQICSRWLWKQACKKMENL